MLVPQNTTPRKELRPDRSQPHNLREYNPYEAMRATIARPVGKNQIIEEAAEMAR